MYLGLLTAFLFRGTSVRPHGGIFWGSGVDPLYRRFGFEPTPAHERQLILLLKDARRFVSA